MISHENYKCVPSCMLNILEKMYLIPKCQNHISCFFRNMGYSLLFFMCKYLKLRSISISVVHTIIEITSKTNNIKTTHTRNLSENLRSGTELRDFPTNE